MKKGVKIIIALVVCGVIGGGIAFSVNNYNSKAKETGIPKNALPVQLEAAHIEDVTTEINAKGVVELVDKNLVYPSTQAKIVEVKFKQGDIVKKGDVLVVYDEEVIKTYKEQLAEARLQLKSAELGLQSTLLPVVSQLEISQAQGGVKQAENAVKDIEAQIDQFDLNIDQIDSNIAIAEDKHMTAKTLFEQGVIAKKEVDTAFEAVKQLKDQRSTVEAQRNKALLSITTAEENVDQANEQLRIILDKETDPMIANKVELQKVQVEQAKLRISQIQDKINEFKKEEICEYDGTILDLRANVGDIASSVNPLMQIADTSTKNLSIKINVPESDAVDLEMGQKVEIKGNALGEKTYLGTVGKISPIAKDKQIGSSLMTVLEVEIIPEETAPVRSGYSVEAVITTKVSKNAVVVPLMSTLSDENGASYVYVMMDNYKVEKRMVELGGYTGMSIEAKSGVKDGEKIIVNPQPQIKEGAFVKPVASTKE